MSRRTTRSTTRYDDETDAEREMSQSTPPPTLITPQRARTLLAQGTHVESADCHCHPDSGFMVDEFCTRCRNTGKVWWIAEANARLDELVADIMARFSPAKATAEPQPTEPQRKPRKPAALVGSPEIVPADLEPVIPTSAEEAKAAETLARKRAGLVKARAAKAAKAEARKAAADAAKPAVKAPAPVLAPPPQAGDIMAHGPKGSFVRRGADGRPRAILADGTDLGPRKSVRRCLALIDNSI